MYFYNGEFVGNEWAKRKDAVYTTSTLCPVSCFPVFEIHRSWHIYTVESTTDSTVSRTMITLNLLNVEDRRSCHMCAYSLILQPVGLNVCPTVDPIVCLPITRHFNKKLITR